MTPSSFFGLPPFAPFTRAASALASVRAFPPLRPKATAAGFLRGKALDRLLGWLRDARERIVADPNVLVSLLRGQGAHSVRGRVWAVVVDGDDAAVGASEQCVMCHAQRIPNRLGFVKGPVFPGDRV